MSVIILTQAIQQESDVVLTRQRARQIATLLGFETQNQIRIATAVSEIARNAFEYAHGGRVEYFVDEQTRPQCFMIRISDKGAGIANLSEILEGRSSSITGSGAGIIGAQRLMDRFSIESTANKGTVVVIGKNFSPNIKKFGTSDLAHLAEQLAQQVIQSPFDEIQQQNQELLRTLEEVRQARDELDNRVQERTAELAKTNSMLVEEITERQRVEEEVRRLNTDLELRVIERTIQLELLNKELEAFSYSVSHDLRAPLRNINSFSKSLAEDYTDVLDTEGRELLDDIRSATLRMGDLIENLLVLSRVTRSEVVVTNVDLSTLAQTVISNLQKGQPDRKVGVVIDQEMFTQGDASLLETVLENLLGNAWKFTEKQPHPQIYFGVTEQEGEVTYYIRDNGAGFNMKYINKLFTPFQRLHKADDFQGTGIGLATVQRIISRHRGRAWAEGLVGEGATFYFTLHADNVTD